MDAGMRVGELALSLPRHFSVRDLFKWAARMSSLRGQQLGVRGLQPLAVGVQALLDAVTGCSTHATSNLAHGAFSTVSVNIVSVLSPPQPLAMAVSVSVYILGCCRK